MPPQIKTTKTDRYGVRSVWSHLAMCTATAVLLTLAFPRPGWSFMAWFALVPVGVLTMRTRRLWTLAWTSYLVFFVWWALRVMWLKHVQAAAPFAMASVCALYFSLALVMLAAVQRRYRGAMTLTLPLFWTAQEIIRSVFPVGGFAWFTLASSQAAWLPGQHPGYIVQAADLFGWPTVSFLVAMASGLIVDLIGRPLTKRKASGALRPRRTVLTAMCLWLGGTAAAMVYGYQRLADAPDPDDPAARSVTLGIVQTNVPQSNKSQGSGLDLYRKKLDDFDRLLALTKATAQDEPRPDLIVWPETVITVPINDEAIAAVLDGAPRPPAGEIAALYRSALIDRDKQALDALQLGPHSVLYYRDAVDALVQTLGLPIVVGSQTNYFPSHDRSMNSALFVQPGAESYQRYSKMHRVPMGEYIPGPAWFQDLFLKHISPYEYDYTVQPGEGVVIFETQPDATGPEPTRAGATQPGDAQADAEPVRFAAPICYEDAIAIQCRKMVYGPTGEKRADLLVNLTNDGWYPGSHQGFQHVQIATLRCIENRVPMARSVNTGVSGLIDSSGRVGPLVSENGHMQEVAGHVNASVVLDPRPTLYGKLREGVWVGVCVAAGLLFLGVFVPHGRTRLRPKNPR